MEQDEKTDEERTEVQTDYSDYNSNTDLSNNDTVQRDYTCSNVPYGQLNISCAQITALEVYPKIFALCIIQNKRIMFIPRLVDLYIEN